ncbi:hypothetical protein [Listeria monocytogenes]|nr:hypothetical protein [Listeria monocytogenes]
MIAGAHAALQGMVQHAGAYGPSPDWRYHERLWGLADHHDGQPARP